MPLSRRRGPEKPEQPGRPVMESRRNICGKCRHKLGPTEANTCPGCEKLSPDRANANGGGNGSPGENVRKCRAIRNLVHKIFNKISGQDINEPVHQKLGSQNHMISPSCSLNAVRPKKRALLIGITYTKWKYKLKGTVNDVNRMKAFLICRYKFPINNIRVLTEEESHHDRIPTKKNIEESLKWLVEGCEEGDSLVFYFSGHGVRTPDFKEDEIDGFDETLCPVDFLEKGVIVDNEINSTIVRPLPKGVTLHAFVDACHSGTVLDLVHIYNRDQKRWLDNFPPSGANKNTNGGLAICISACEDNQVAADTSAFGSGEETNGAMTYLLVEIVKECPQISYGGLLDSMCAFLDDANKSGGRLIKILRRLFNRRLLQKPLLSASEKFDVYERTFKL